MCRCENLRMRRRREICSEERVQYIEQTRVWRLGFIHICECVNVHLCSREYMCACMNVLRVDACECTCENLWFRHFLIVAIRPVIKTHEQRSLIYKRVRRKMTDITPKLFVNTSSLPRYEPSLRHINFGRFSNSSFSLRRTLVALFSIM
jgi:hypothetical protein